ncbi:MAG TPA: hypothetical protein ENK31_03315 [Nannocystis exedens]|nr:hypothetical protein [Nannocystis exedens]
MPGLLRRLSAAWPQLRAIFIAYHLLAVVVLSLPSAGAITSPRMWRSANFKADIAGYAAAIRGLGIDMTAEQFGARLHAAAVSFAGFRSAIATPFIPYARIFGVRQGWAMFASPQRNPAWLNVEIKEQGHWRTIYRPHDDDATWMRETMEHNRMRKFAGRFARTFVAKNYDELSRWLASQAIVSYPTATAVRVRLYQTRSLPASEIRTGKRPRGRYHHAHIFSAAELRP